jgi:hypothetical protein
VVRRVVRIVQREHIRILERLPVPLVIPALIPLQEPRLVLRPVLQEHILVPVPECALIVLQGRTAARLDPRLALVVLWASILLARAPLLVPAVQPVPMPF